jgi:hypothetical protein
VTPEERAAREVLGVGADASPDEVRRAFRDLARCHHPDRTRHLDDDARARHAGRFRDVQAAWSYLSGRRAAPTDGPAPQGAGHPPPHWAEDAPAGLHHERLDPADLDPRPIVRTEIPRWIVLAPAALLLLSAVVFGASVILAATPLWNLAGVLFLLSLLSFALAPFLVMLRAGR